MKNSYQYINSYLRAALMAVVAVVAISLWSTMYVSAQEATDDVALVEKVNLAVRFKNGAGTVRRGSKGLKELKYYDPELIEYVAFKIATSMSGRISGTDSIGVVLNYVKAGDFTAKFPYPMEVMTETPSSERKPVSDDGAVVTFTDGTKKIFEGSDITKLKSLDPEKVQNIEMLSSPELEAYIAKNIPKSDKVVEIKPIEPIEPTEPIESTEPTVKPKEVVEQTPAKPKPRIDYYDLSREQFMVIESDDFKYEEGMVAYRRDGYTEVDLKGAIFYSKQWFSFPVETYIVDPQTLERYKIIEATNDIPLDRYLRVIEQVGRTVLFTLIFPPLPEGVKSVNLVGSRIKDQPVPALASEDAAWECKNISILGDVPRAYHNISDR